MGKGAGDPPSDADRQEMAEQVYQSLLSAVALIERSSPAVLRDLRDSLEVEIMIDRSGRQRRRLLREVSDYCDRRLRDRESAYASSASGGVSGVFRAIVTGRRRPAGRPNGGL